MNLKMNLEMLLASEASGTSRTEAFVVAFTTVNLHVSLRRKEIACE
jgi:hypothetical protein